MLSAIVSLINEKYLSTVSIGARWDPCIFVIIDTHSASLFKNLHYGDKLIGNFFIDVYSSFFYLSLIKIIGGFFYWCSLWCSSNKSEVVLMISFSEKQSPLMLVLETHFFRSFTAIKLHKRGASTSAITGMITFAKLVEFCDNILQILCVVVSENYWKFLFHLFKED